MISFEKLAAEYLVRKTGLSMNPELEAHLITLFRSVKEGDFCCPIETSSIFPKSLWEEGLEGEPLPKSPLVIQGNRLYLQKTWALETLVLQKIGSLWARPIYGGNPLRFEEEFTKMKERLNSAQQEAILGAFDKGLAIFTGGPGTGKSYTAGCFIRLLAAAQVQSFTTIIAAPTGKAAAHLEIALRDQGPLPDGLKCESTTLHRLLKLQPHRLQLNSEKLLDADLVVVDEASMLDASLLLHLLNAIGPATRLLFLGDQYQLPPIEGSGFFPEMADLFGYKLEQSMRTGEGALLELSQAILAGDATKALQIQGEAVQWLPWVPDSLKLAHWLSEQLPSVYYRERPDPLQVLQGQKKFRVLSALRQGPFGVDAINRHIMATISQEKRGGWTVIPILIVQNNGAQQLYNGTTGILIREKGKARSTAYFIDPEGVRAVPEAALPPYEISFCLSVHKSQGSEFEEALILLGPGAERFGKEALYTAVTRAKKKVRLCMEETTFRATLDASRQKKSGFRERIGSYTRCLR